MRETCDKRRRNDLDLFVPALIGSGASTPYARKTTAVLFFRCEYPHADTPDGKGIELAEEDEIAGKFLPEADDGECDHSSQSRRKRPSA